MILTGDEVSGDSLLAVFCARVIFTDILDFDHPDFTALSFQELYKCWLEQIEIGVVSTHIDEQGSAVYKPGEFPNDENQLILETGAFLVSLIPQHRAMILLVYGEGFTYQEAADILITEEAELTFSISQACSRLAGENKFVASGKAQDNLHENASGLLPKTGLEKKILKAKEPKTIKPVAAAVAAPISMDDQGTFISKMKVR